MPAARATRLARRRADLRPVALVFALHRTSDGRSAAEFHAAVHWQVDGHIACVECAVRGEHGLDYDAFIRADPTDRCPFCLTVMFEGNAVADRDAALLREGEALIATSERAIAADAPASRVREITRSLRRILKRRRRGVSVSDGDVLHQARILDVELGFADARGSAA